jgi:hypothetical protein
MTNASMAAGAMLPAAVSRTSCANEGAKREALSRTANAGVLATACAS